MPKRLQFDHSISCELEKSKKKKKSKKTKKSRKHIIPLECRKDKELKEVLWNGKGCSPKLGKKVFKGGYGQTYDTCCGKNCDYITKIIPFQYEKTKKTHVFTKSDFLNEIENAQIAGKANIAPKILKASYNNNEGVIIMEKLKGKMLKSRHARYIKDAPEQTPAQVKRNAKQLAMEIGPLIRKLHSLGIFHGDAHRYNIMKTTKQKGGIWKLIDFGMSGKFDPYLEEEMLRHIKDDYLDTLLYLRRKNEGNLDIYNDNQYLYINTYYSTLQKYLDGDIKKFRSGKYKTYNRSRK
jgi:tRNA A-37 threonylcarbamoyl transferase component Bud32